MNEYRKLLVLQYLDEVKKEYKIQEIFQRLGFEIEQGIILIEEMFEEDLLEYKNNLINITKKGREILDKVPNNDMEIYEGNILMNRKISPKLKIGEIYIPKNF